MKKGLLGWAALVCFFWVGMLSSASAEAPKGGKILYDTKADGNAQIKSALAKAEQENKNVILKFGANWCGWCHRLSGVFKENAEIAALLNSNYILVLIDVDQGHNEDVVKRYGTPTRYGLPALV